MKKWKDVATLHAYCLQPEMIIFSLLSNSVMQVSQYFAPDRILVDREVYQRDAEHSSLGWGETLEGGS